MPEKKEIGIAKRKGNKIQIWATILLAGSLLLACMGNRPYYDEYLPIPKSQWMRGNTPFFEFEINDTIQRYDLYFNIRHSRSYEWKNLWVFSKFELPDGLVEIDTLEFILQDANGRWLGKGSGAIRDGSFLFKTKTRFPRKGKYRASFEQAMRTEVLEDISDVGFKIQESVE